MFNRDIADANTEELNIVLSASDVQNLLATINLPPKRPKLTNRTALLTEIVIGSRQSAAFDFGRARLFVAPQHFAKDENQAKKEWKDRGFAEFLGGANNGPSSVSAVFTNPLPNAISSMRWTSVRVGVDGTFTALFTVTEKTPFNAWSWLLTGGGREYGMLGVIYPDDLTTEDDDSQVRAIVLPVPSANRTAGEITSADTVGSTKQKYPGSVACCGGLGRVPTVASERELANNPSVYTEDPGAFCQPFKNPERILSEKSFYSIVRVEQPEISARASEVIRRPIIDINKDIFLRDPTTLHISEARDLTFHPTVVAPLWPGLFAGLGSGRHVMNAEFPMQWEGDSLRYQAITVAKGHILEFRMRTRSNGYSLGGVAKTLTLAPRQTKRKSPNTNDVRSLTSCVRDPENRVAAV